MVLIVALWEQIISEDDVEMSSEDKGQGHLMDFLEGGEYHLPALLWTQGINMLHKALAILSTNFVEQVNLYHAGGNSNHQKL